MKRYIPFLCWVTLGLCVVKTASADFIYDVQLNAHSTMGHQQFISPTILTVGTSVTTFTINTGSPFTITELCISPGFGDTCDSSSGNSFSGPSIAWLSGTREIALASFPTAFESVGRFEMLGIGSVTIFPVASIPEPSTLLLMGMAVVVFALVRSRHFRSTLEQSEEPGNA
jgi:hypothetical protein